MRPSSPKDKLEMRFAPRVAVPTAESGLLRNPCFRSTFQPVNVCSTSAKDSTLFGTGNLESHYFQPGVARLKSVPIPAPERWKWNAINS